jgi:hypothetical protein
MTQRLRFQTGDIAKTGWSDHSFNGAFEHGRTGFRIR